ncbi:response regulator [Pasteurellaceae bacterium 20609_3]|uniref:response regulator n=1 Tax=Spirabiliibacterium mucosae TaxID=28156 RepID=UPI001F21854D|nr:response regulator [Spirabiliibacterium mucosae]MBE2898265.1 response regulator [Spirabiliibacterium mucosae]
MNNIKLLLVEDSREDIKICQNAVDDFNNDNTEFKVCLEVCKTVEEAEEKLKQSDFDGVIVDMKLTSSEPDDGNKVIQKIKNSLRRIPVVIMTGTPYFAEQDDFPLIKRYIKGEHSYSEIIEKFRCIYCTGLTRILGGKGTIEEKLATIFIRNLLPRLDSWIKYAEYDPTRTEKALLRHTLNHLIQYLDNDINRCYPEEMYISPPVNDRINTGSILKKKESDEYFIVMNPACDLAERENGRCNTDRALLVEIQPLQEITKKKKNIEIHKNKTFYYHFLPETDFYLGGVINFRRVSTFTEDDIKNLFDSPQIQISPPFLKDIISRFSSYYARQGQPDIDIAPQKHL